MGIEDECERSAQAASGSKLSVTELRSWPSCATTTTAATAKESAAVELGAGVARLVTALAGVRGDMLTASSSPIAKHSMFEV